MACQAGEYAQRVSRDSAASDAQLALQECVRLQGGAALRENPFNSLHWHDPVEVHLWDSGAYEDTAYHACVFHSERAKHQRLLSVDLRNSLAARGGSVSKPRPACKPPRRVQVGPSAEHRCLLLNRLRKIQPRWICVLKRCAEHVQKSTGMLAD